MRGPDATAQQHVIHPQGHEIATPQLAVDGEIEHGEVAQSFLDSQADADGPDLSFNGGFWPISLPRFQGLKGSGLVVSGVDAVSDVMCVAPGKLLRPRRVEVLPRAEQGREPAWPREARQFPLPGAMLRLWRFPMGVVQLPDELQRVIERQVAEGRAASPAAFLEEAVRRLVDEARDEEDETASGRRGWLGRHQGRPSHDGGQPGGRTACP